MMILKLRTLKPEEAIPGDKVIINFNPHESIASDIVGTITDYRPGEGFGGCDLVEGVSLILTLSGPSYRAGQWFEHQLDSLSPAITQRLENRDQQSII